MDSTLTEIVVFKSRLTVPDKPPVKGYSPPNSWIKMQQRCGVVEDVGDLTEFQWNTSNVSKVGIKGRYQR